jgi:predicted MPP superfamily phosphohydrolase
MKLAIIQISDFHIKTSTDPILRRSQLVGAAIKDVAAQADGILIGFTGDIAFSGKPEQYKLALEFVGRMLDEVRKTGKQTELFAIPGNHDLDFSIAPDTRDVLLQSVGTNPEKVKVDGDTVQQILRVQEHFFAFEAELLRSELRQLGQRISGRNSSRPKISVFMKNVDFHATNPL